jgi:hypothetical protein
MDKSLIYTTTNDKMLARHSTYFSGKDNTVFADGDEWHPVYNYIQEIFDLPVRDHARTLWKKRSSLDEIKKITKYVSNAHVVLGLFDESGKGKTPVMTKSGLHMFLKTLPKEDVSPKLRDIAEKYMAQFIAAHASCIANAGAKAASSAPIPQLYREAIASERAAGDVNVVPPLNNKRKSDADKEICDWKKDPRAYNVLVTQFQKNRDEIANAEVKVIEKVGDAQVNAIELDATGKKSVADAEAAVHDAEAARIKALTALLQFELQQKQNATGNTTDATQSKEPPPPVTAANDPPPPAAGPSLAQRIVRLAPLFFARSNTPAAAVSAAPTPAKDKVAPAAKRTRKSTSCAKQTPSPAKENAPNNSKHSTKQSLLYAKDQNPPVRGAGGKLPSTAPIMQFFTSGTKDSTVNGDGMKFE